MSSGERALAVVSWLVALVALGCGGGVAASSVETTGVLDRAPRDQQVEIQHVLIGYAGREQAAATAQRRERSAAETLILELHRRAKSGESFEALMKVHSEDAGSADGSTYTVHSESPFDPRLVYFSLRLGRHEMGIVHTAFGYHLVRRL